MRSLVTSILLALLSTACFGVNISPLPALPVDNIQPAKSGSVPPSAGLAPPLNLWQPIQDNKPAELKSPDSLVFWKTLGGKTFPAVRGTGNSQVYWRSPGIQLKPGSIYTFRFKTKGTGSGSVIGRVGDSIVNGFEVPREWTPVTCTLLTPETGGETYLKLDQWMLNGEAIYTQPELYPAQAIYSRWSDLTLGEGEQLSSTGEYVDDSGLGSSSTPIHRTLLRQNAHYNGNRWNVGGGTEIVYRHELPYNMQKASLSVQLGYYSKGKLIISASRDGQNWTRVAEAAANGRMDKDVPGSLFPTKQLYVRFSMEGDYPSTQVNMYRFQAQTDYAGESRLGKTSIVEEHTASPDLSASWEPADNGWKVQLTNNSVSDRILHVTAWTDGKMINGQVLTLHPGGKADHNIFRPASAGKHTVTLQVNSNSGDMYLGQMDISNTVLAASDYGYLLDSGRAGLTTWWCEGAWKVGPGRRVPTTRKDTIAIEAAKGEFEPAQLVLNANEPGTVLNDVRVSDLIGKKGRIPASCISLFEVATVNIERPSDYLGEAGDCPDPLPPLKTPLNLEAKHNQAIWVLLHAPENVPAGDYFGSITLKTNRGEVRSRLKVRIFGFTMPKETHLKSALGLNTGAVNRYHNLKTTEQQRQVFDLYMRSYADHRIAPYSFYPYDWMGVKFEGDGDKRHPAVDFTSFDKAAERYLNGFKFNTFQLALQGLGGSSFVRRTPGEFGGFKAGTPEYDRLMADYLRQIEDHLRQKGWLDKAYIYWFDEPDTKDYAFVVEGMDRIKTFAPGLHRMLTEQPEPQLLGYVDIWCPVLQMWDSKVAADRRKAGDETWWYVACTRAPYFGEFMEHPATEMRVWPWMSWQHGMQGILVWETASWTPDLNAANVQDPWQDPATWLDEPAGLSGGRTWYANGEGRYLYPPRRDPNQPQPPAIEPPISSIRWENLRDGMEDYEYLYLLNKQISRVGRKAPRRLMARAKALLKVPQTICKGPTDYTFDPRPILNQRRRVAEMIMTLQKVK